MQAAFGGVQMPQLGLQQTCPRGQTARPHGSPPAGGSQNRAMQASPIGAQVPQLGLQQYSPRPHLFDPQG